MNNMSTGQDQEDADSGRDLDINALVRILWRGKWLIGSLAAAGTAVALVYAFLAPQIYRSEALLQVRELSGSNGGLGGLAAIAAQIGGLPGLGGLSAAGGADRQVAVATLSSRSVIEPFITDRNLLPRLYPSKWDSGANAWKDPAAAPTVWQAYNDFKKKILSVSDDRKTGLLTLGVEWTDPAEAQQWVTELVSRTNAHLKERAVDEGQRNLAYLQSQAKEIGQVALAQALYGLVEEQLKQLMMAKGGDEFALKTIDPAVVPKKKIAPKRGPIAVAGFLIGSVLGAMAALGLAMRGARSTPRGQGPSP